MTYIPSKVQFIDRSSKDDLIAEYADTGLAGTTKTEYIEGVTFRKYSLGFRHVPGGTLDFKIYVSNENVAYGSVSQWVDKTSDFVGSASLSASGIYQFSCFYKWIRFEWITTSTGNSLAYEIWIGW